MTQSETPIQSPLPLLPILSNTAPAAAATPTASMHNTVANTTSVMSRQRSTIQPLRPPPPAKPFISFRIMLRLMFAWVGGGRVRRFPLLDNGERSISLAGPRWAICFFATLLPVGGGVCCCPISVVVSQSDWAGTCGP